MRFIFFIILHFPILAYSQDTLVISYNDSIHLELRNSKFKFKIKEGQSIIELNELSINNYQFKKNGLFLIYVESLDKHKHNEDCSHAVFPDSFFVYVDSIKMKFDPSSIQLSKPIVQNQSTEGIVLSINVEIENYFKTKITMNSNPIFSAGIGTNIIGNLDKEFHQLNSGKYKLKYNLSGLCSQPSYIQFDFIHHNGHIDPIALPNPISKH